MDQALEFYKRCIKHLLAEYQSLKNDWSEVELLFDDERMHYMALRVGWFNQKRIYLCLVHIDICDTMIVIQANNTEDLIDDELIEMGIPKEKMCLGLLPPEVREYAAQQRRERQEALKKPLQQTQNMIPRPSPQLA